MDGLFPSVPKDITKMSDEELADLLAEHDQAKVLIDQDDPEFLKGLSADEIIEQYEKGAEAIIALRAEVKAREDAAEAFTAKKAEIAARVEVEPVAEAEPEDDDDDAGDATDDDAEDDDTADEATTPTAEAEEVSDPIAEKVLVTASAEVETPEPELVVEKPRMRRVPMPARERTVETPEPEIAFVASGFQPGTPPGAKLESKTDLAEAVHAVAKSVGRPAKRVDGREERFLVASLDYSSKFPPERRLDGDAYSNSEKIAAIGNPFLGQAGQDALVASGGFCAPLQPIYSMPQLATQARPVRDALPNFRAERGGINVPTPTTIGDAAGAITVISAAEDALGGTFATKACLDMDCPDYNEYAVTIISHCREFGNLNAMAWPEKISHENELTMAAHARTAETYLLDQIKALSAQVTDGAETLGALIYLVDALEKAKYGIRSRLRMPAETRFQLLAPRALLDILELDTVQTQFDRYRTKGEIEGYLGDLGVDVTWYLDSPSTGVSQIADAAEEGGTLDGLPDIIQLAFFPAGTFLHLDMAELNLGIVRDSTLNSTNDFQVFGESFENVALIGPPQAAYWIELDVCATGQFAPAGTVRTCD